MTPSPRLSRLPWLALTAALCWCGLARAQLAGSGAAMGHSPAESTQRAPGWSVKNALLGKAVFNEKGERIGKVEDVILGSDHQQSYAIIGVGGLVILGCHDVAVAVERLQDSSGKLVLSGASQSSLKAMPAFHYAGDASVVGARLCKTLQASAS